MKKCLLLLLLMAAMLPWAVNAQIELVVNDNTAMSATVPFYGPAVAYGVQSQFIIPATDLEPMQESYITGMTFYGDLKSVGFDVNFQVLLQAVDTTIFPTPYPAFWDKMHAVYSGQASVSDYEMHIDFGAPFPYLNHNLLIGIRTSTTGNEVTNIKWYGKETNENTAIENYANSSYQYYAYTLEQFLPKIKFTFSEMSDTVCARPTNLQVTDITQTEATVSWTGNANDYTLEWKTAEEQVWSHSVDNLADTSYTLSGLTPLTTYDLRVRSNCDTVSTAFILKQFMTLPIMSEADNGWSDDFEGASCDWYLINGDLTNRWVWGEATKNGGTHALYISDDGGANNSYNNLAEAVVYAAKLLHFDGGKYQFGYDWLSYGYDGADFVRAALIPMGAEPRASHLSWDITFNSLPTDWIALDGGMQLGPSMTWRSRSEAVRVPEGDYYLIFAWNNLNLGLGLNPPAAVDNISITKWACPHDVTGLAVDAITPNSAHLSWTAGEATQWQVVYGTSDDFVSATEVTVSDPSYALTGLDDNTDYVVRVRAYCGGSDYGEWSEVRSFSTPCYPITSFPWVEDFEEQATGTFDVRCWKNQGSRLYEVADGYGDDTTHVLQLTHKNNPDEYGELYCPVMTIPDGDEYQLKLDIYRSDFTSVNRDELIILASPDGNEQNATLMGRIPLKYSESNQYVSAEAQPGWYTYEFAIPLTGECHLLLMGTLNFTVLTLDNLTVRKTPVCAAPTDLFAYGVDCRKAFLSWVPGTETSEWKLAYKTAADADFTEIDVDRNPYVFEGLAEETEYTVKVRAKCPEINSEYSNEATFTTTTCCLVPEFGRDSINNVSPSSAHVSWGGEADDYELNYRTAAYYDGLTEDFEYEWEFARWQMVAVNNANNFNFGRMPAAAHTGNFGFSFCSFNHANNYNQYLVSPEIETQSDSLFFYYRATNWMPEVFRVGYSSTDNDLSHFAWGDTIEIASGEFGDNTPRDWTLFGEAIPAGTKYIAINYFSENHIGLHVDDIHIGNEVPAGEWAEVPSAAHSYDLTGLAARTTYEVRVRSVCGGLDGNSKWSQTSIFRTFPPCHSPSDLHVDAIGSDTADFSWNTNGQTGFNLRYSTDGINWTVVQDISTPYTLTGLRGNTEYQAQVQASCETDEWTPSVEFRTECGTITIDAEHPYVEDFETPVLTTNKRQNILPYCWEEGVERDDRRAQYQPDGWNYVHTGQSLVFLGGCYNYVKLPKFSNALNELQLSFDWVTGSLSSGTLSVGYITAADNNYNTFTPIKSFEASEDSYRKLTSSGVIYLDEMPAGATYLVIKWLSGGGSCSLDNLVVRSANVVAMDEAGYATYFNPTQAYAMPEGLTGNVFSTLNTPKLQEVYTSGDIVPAATPLVLKATGSIALPHTFELPFTTGGVAPKNVDNQLVGVSEQSVVGISANASDSLFYILSLNAAQDFDSIGFYYMKAGGAGNFTMPARRAYLRVPKPTQAGAPAAYYVFNENQNATWLDNLKEVKGSLKFIRNNTFYILCDGIIYDATGRKVRKLE